MKTITDDQIRAVFLANGFTIKEGQTDLKPYVFQAARALLALAQLEPLTKPIRDADDELLTGQTHHLIGALMNHGLLLPEKLDETQYRTLWDVVKRELRCVNREGARAAQSNT